MRLPSAQSRSDGAVSREMKRNTHLGRHVSDVDIVDRHAASPVREDRPVGQRSIRLELLGTRTQLAARPVGHKRMCSPSAQLVQVPEAQVPPRIYQRSLRSIASSGEPEAHDAVCAGHGTMISAGRRNSRFHSHANYRSMLGQRAAER